MGEDDDTTTVVTQKTVDLYRSVSAEIMACVHTADLLKEHMSKVGLDRPITIGIEFEYGQYDTTIQKAIIRIETEVEK